MYTYVKYAPNSKKYSKLFFIIKIANKEDLRQSIFVIGNYFIEILYV